MRFSFSLRSKLRWVRRTGHTLSTTSIRLMASARCEYECLSFCTPHLPSASQARCSSYQR